jgi:hypothetical protein
MGLIRLWYSRASFTLDSFFVISIQNTKEIGNAIPSIWKRLTDAFVDKNNLPLSLFSKGGGKGKLF